MRIVIRSAVAALACLVFVPRAADAQAPAHNYVNFDLTWRLPDPSAPKQWNVVLFDSGSARKIGDWIEFDELVLNPSPNVPAATPNPSPFAELMTSTFHTQISCGWRTSRRLGRDYFAPWPSNADSITDKLCAGAPLGAARGAKSIDEAVAFWRPYFPAPRKNEPNTVNTITVQNTVANPAGQRWNDPESHEFVKIYSDPYSGNVLFLDRASLKSDSSNVGVETLATLGPDSERKAGLYEAIASLRTVKVDCAKRSLKELKRQDLTKFLTASPFVSGADTAGIRVASESPVTAVEIGAACGAPPASEKTFSTVEDAWLYARSTWPPRAAPSWPACLWNNLPTDARAEYFSDWAVLTGPNPPEPDLPPQFVNLPASLRDEFLHRQRYPGLPKLTPASIAACAVPQASASMAQYVLSEYAIEQAALNTLSTSGIDETKIAAAWDKLGWDAQQLYVLWTMEITADTTRNKDAVLARIGDDLGVPRSDPETLKQVDLYLAGRTHLQNQY